MKNKLIFSIIASFAIFANLAFSDNTPSISIDEIAEKMKNAADPNGIYKNAKSFFIVQTMHIGDSELRMETSYKSPLMSRCVTLLDGKVVNTTIFNNDKAWSISPDGKATEITGAELETMKAMNRMQEPNTSIKDVFSNISVSEQRIGQNDFFVLKCSTSASDFVPMEYFVDKKDFLTKRIVTQRQGKPYIAEIKKYSLYQGVLVAAETQIEYGNVKQTILINDYKLNVEFENTLFRP